MWFLRPSSRKAPLQEWDLRKPLLHLTRNQGDIWTIGDSFEGVHIFGAIGSGKTSGSGAAIARAFLSSGFGGLVLTAKHDEVSLWKEYAKNTGAESQLLIFSPASEHRFNFLNYEYHRNGGGQTENIVNLFYSLIETIEGDTGRTSDSYWDRTLKQLLRNAVDLVAVADDEVTLTSIKDVITSAPSSPEEFLDPNWQARSYCFNAINRGDQRMESGEVTGTRSHDFVETCRFWFSEFPTLNERTRSIIVSSFTSMADCFLRGELRNLFCTNTTITPDSCIDGKIIVLDLPIKQWGEIGRYAQLLFKYMWQSAIERRTGAQLERPVFLWADEAQFFISPRDLDFQTTARSSRVATVYLSQNLPNYYAMAKTKDRVHALLGNFNTKIFHANSDSVTNEWAADMIARSWQSKVSVNSSEPEKEERKDKIKSHYSVSQNLEYDVIPQFFTKMRNGGFRNRREVDGIFFQSGRLWSNGKTYLKLIFQQDLL